MATRLGEWSVRRARSALAGIFFVGYGLGSLLIGLLLFPPLALFGAHHAMRSLVRASWRLLVWGGRATGLFRIEIQPEDRACLAAAHGRVVVANHPTLIDIVVLTVMLPEATAIAKAAARGNFFYAAIVKGIFLVNDDPMHVLEESERLLRAGVNIVVFPQGTRTPVGEQRPFHRGAAQIALHAAAPILPVTITCNSPVLAKNQPWYDMGDRTLVWRLAVHDEISVVAPPGHAAAVALTERIRDQLSASPPRAPRPSASVPNAISRTLSPPPPY